MADGNRKAPEPEKRYIAEGLFQSQEEIDNSPTQNLGSKPMPGDIKYRDVDGNGVIDSKDQVMISKTANMPRIQYGFGVNIDWKTFQLRCILQRIGYARH